MELQEWLTIGSWMSDRNRIAAETRLGSPEEGANRGITFTGTGDN